MFQPTSGRSTPVIGVATGQTAPASAAGMDGLIGLVQPAIKKVAQMIAGRNMQVHNPCESRVGTPVSISLLIIWFCFHTYSRPFSSSTVSGSLMTAPKMSSHLLPISIRRRCHTVPSPEDLFSNSRKESIGVRTWLACKRFVVHKGCEANKHNQLRLVFLILAKVFYPFLILPNYHVTSGDRLREFHRSNFYRVHLCSLFFHG